MGIVKVTDVFAYPFGNGTGNVLLVPAVAYAGLPANPDCKFFYSGVAPVLPGKVFDFLDGMVKDFRRRDFMESDRQLRFIVILVALYGCLNGGRVGTRRTDFFAQRAGESFKQRP